VFASALPHDQRVRDPRWLRAARWARLLSWVSLAWMTGEGLLGLVAGLDAGSVSLLGWAVGSVIEGLASVIVIWRFTGARTLSETAEARAQRAVAASFFLLAPYLVVQSVHDLATGHAADHRLGHRGHRGQRGRVPALGIPKRHLGASLESRATVGEGVQNLICAAQAAAVLIGLAVTAVYGWTWVDPAVALLLAAWAIREGIEAWQGDT
jgi:divalent metal cation (Fe/Co/Zn/Cd) transporter